MVHLQYLLELLKIFNGQQSILMRKYIFILGLVSLSACDILTSTQQAPEQPQREVVDREKIKLKKDNQRLNDSIFLYREQLAYLKRSTLNKPQAITVDTNQAAILMKDSLMKSFVKQIFTASPTPHYPLRINLFENSFDALIVKIKKSKIKFFWNNPKSQIPYRSFANVKSTLKTKENKELIFATNGGMFTPTMEPKGLYVEDEKVIRPLDTISGRVGNFNFYLQPNGVFYLTAENNAHIITTQEYRYFPPVDVKYATQSGPMLVIDNQIHPAFRKGSRNKYIRSGVGLIDSDHLVFIISNRPVNFFDFASLFRDFFGCQNALYLDGAISDMYLPELKREYLNGNFGPIIGIIE